jgi:hypothetical protein
VRRIRPLSFCGTDLALSFTGSAGQAIITHNKAYLLVDSRYYIQAEQQLEKDWTLVRLGETSTSPRSWTQWLVEVCLFRSVIPGIPEQSAEYSRQQSGPGCSADLALAGRVPERAAKRREGRVGISLGEPG